MSDAGGDYDDPGWDRRSRFMLPQLRVAIQRAVRIGVKFATGADTEYSRRSVARVPGEIAHLVDAGLMPLRRYRRRQSAAPSCSASRRRQAASNRGSKPT